MITDYKNLIVWQKGLKLSIEIYKLTESFPKSEIFSLTSQMRRSAVSIPSNIAEGRCRGSNKEFVNFLRIAYGSGAELQTQISIAKQLPFGAKLDYNGIEAGLEEVMLMLRSMVAKIPHFAS